MTRLSSHNGYQLGYTTEQAYELGYDIAKHHPERLSFREAVQLQRKMACEWRGHEYGILAFDDDKALDCVYCKICDARWNCIEITEADQ